MELSTKRYSIILNEYKRSQKFQNYKNAYYQYKKLDIMRFILENFSKFPTQIKF